MDVKKKIDGPTLSVKVRPHTFDLVGLVCLVLMVGLVRTVR